MIEVHNINEGKNQRQKVTRGGKVKCQDMHEKNYREKEARLSKEKSNQKVKNTKK